MTVKVSLELEELQLQISGGPEQRQVETFAANRADQAFDEGMRQRHVRHRLDCGGRLDVTVCSEDADTQQLDRLVAHPDFPPSSNRRNNGVDVQIDLRSGDGDGVDVAAALLVKMLKAIDASYPALSKQFIKPSSR